MRYLGEDDATRMMGVGYLGEVRQGPDGALYQYVQGVDGLGNPIGGFWSRIKKLTARALPFAQQVASFIPGYGTAVATALKAVTPILQKAGVAGYDGFGALYEAADGSLYQVQGLAQDEELRGIGEDDATRMMGIGTLGEVRQGPDGAVYQYVQGVDGLGNLTGWWSRLRKVASRVAQFHPVAQALKAARPLISKALPIAQQVASVIPGGTEALTAATPILKEAGVAGYGGLGALYQAPDGTMYQQVQGLDDDAELRGLDADDELHGLDDDPELRGFDDDMELRGLEEDMELRGLDDSEDLRGFEADQDMQGVAGYVRQDRMSGLERYEPEQPPQTRWHVAPSQPPKVWKRAW